MKQSKVIDEFYQNRYCDRHKKLAEHIIQTIDEEGNGEYIGYYSECLVCNYVEEIDYSPKSICLNCGHSFSTEQNQLICVLDQESHKKVGDYDSCNEFN